MSREIYLIDSIEGAKHILKSKSYKKGEIITLNYGVSNYLNMFSIKSKNINEYFKNSEIRFYLKKSRSLFLNTLNALDNGCITNFFLKKEKIKKFFYPVFSVKYQRSFSSYFLFKMFLQKIIKSRNKNITILYDANLLKDLFPIYELLKKNKNFKKIKFKIIKTNSNKIFENFRFLNIDVFHWINFIIRKMNIFYIKKIIEVRNILKMNRAKILLLNYDINLLKFLSKKNLNIIFFDELEKKKKFTSLEIFENLIQIINSKKKTLDGEILYFIENSLKNNLEIDTKLVLKICNQKSLKYILWRYPIAHSFNKNLIVNNSLNKKRIIGFQHGAHYLTKRSDFHFEQDFNNCNYWISYNSSEEDYTKIYAKRKKKCKIVKQKFIPKKIIDKVYKNEILYPLRQLYNFYTGTIEDKLVIINQLEILKYLESLKRQYTIKTVFPLNRENCAFIDTFKKLKYAKIISSISLQHYLNKNEFKLIILDNYDTTLYDSIQFSNNSKILMLDNKNEFGKTLQKNFKSKIPERVAIFNELNLFKKSIKKNFYSNYRIFKSDIKKKNNFAFTSYNILNKIIK